METHLLQVLVCPVCKGKLEHHRQQQQLICLADKLVFPIRDGIPLMLQSEATALVDTHS